MDRGAWQATVHGVTRGGHDLVTNERERAIFSCLGGKYYIKFKIYLYENSNIFFHLETTSLTQYTHNMLKYQSPINFAILHERIFKTKCFYCIKYVCVNKG